MPMWGIVLTILFSGLTTVAVIITLFWSFRFSTKDDIERLERQIENLNLKIDRHLEGHDRNTSN